MKDAVEPTLRTPQIAFGRHRRQEEVAELHDRAHVEAHHLGVGRAVVVEKVAPFAEAGVVDEKVDREAPAADLLEQALGRAVRGEVECDDLDLYAAGGTKLGRKSLEPVRRPRGENKVR